MELKEQAERLVASWQAGDDRETCFRGLFELYNRPIHHFFARRGLAPEESRDLAQETFLKVFRGMDDFRRDASFETWLFSVATNVWRNRLRDGKASKRDGEEVGLEAFDDGEERLPATANGPLTGDERPGPLDSALAGERAQLLRQVLAEMPPQMRMCLVLRLDQDLKYREIASVLRISVDNVKAQLHRARQRLKDRLSPYFSDFDRGGFDRGGFDRGNFDRGDFDRGSGGRR